MSTCYAPDCGPLISNFQPNLIQVAGIGTSATTPVYDVNNQILCEPAPSTQKVLIVSRILANAPPGTAPVVEAYAYPAMTAYGGSVTALQQCLDGVIESIAVQGCASGVNITQWNVTSSGKPTGTVYFTDSSTGAVVTPIGWIPGLCGAGSVTIKTGAYDVVAAIATQASLPGIAAGGILQSITIKNYGVGNLIFTGTDGNPVQIPSGDTQTWSVDDPVNALGSFTANATFTKARISYTYR